MPENLNLGMIFGILSVVVLLVNVIVELVKSVYPLDQIPTNTVVLVLSQVLTNIAGYGYISYAGIVMIWYYIPCIIALGFVVAYAAMYGWEKFLSMWENSKHPNNK